MLRRVSRLVLSIKFDPVATEDILQAPGTEAIWYGLHMHVLSLTEQRKPKLAENRSADSRDNGFR